MSAEDSLSNRYSQLGSLLELSNEQLQELGELKFQPANQTSILDSIKPSTWFEIVELLSSVGYDSAVDFLSQVQDEYQILWERQTFSTMYLKSRVYLELNAKLSDDYVDQDLGNCRFCKSKRLKGDMKQIRSGDEGQAAWVVCLDCGRMSRLA